MEGAPGVGTQQSRDGPSIHDLLMGSPPLYLDIPIHGTLVYFQADIKYLL